MTDDDLVPGSLLGYRCFLYVLGSGLGSITRSYEWGPHTVVAECRSGTLRRHRPDDVPNERCTCGLYAVWDAKDARGEVTVPPLQTWRIGVDVRAVLAAVEATGTVLLGTKGFRAQRARVVGMVLPDPADEPLWARWSARRYERRLRTRYPYTAVVRTEAELLSAFPVERPAALLRGPRRLYGPPDGDWTCATCGGLHARALGSW